MMQSGPVAEIQMDKVNLNFESSKFRNVVPEETAMWIQAIQQNTWKVGKEEPVWIDPPSLG